jgi:hypothetical protein
MNFVIALAAFLVLLKGTVYAQPTDGQAAGSLPDWSTLTVPGTMAAVALAAGIKTPDWERTRFFRELVRVVHQYDRPDGHEPLVRGLGALADVHAALKALPSPVIRIGDEAAERAAAPLLRRLGIRLTGRANTRQAVLVVDEETQAMRGVFVAAGYDAETIVQSLNAEGFATLRPQSFAIPWPMRVADWKARVLGNESLADEYVFASTVASFQASLLYYGLLALDADTLAFVLRERRLLERIRDDAATTFAIYGRSLRVRNGRVAAPGGADGGPLWERWTGERLDHPADFIMAVLGRAEGRLAAVYDLVAHLDEAHTSFALSLWQRDERQRRRAADGLYATYLRISDADLNVRVDANSTTAARRWFLRMSGAEFSVRVYPFRSPPFDPGTAVRHMRLDNSGRPAPPNSRRFWGWVFESDAIPARSPQLESADEPRDLIDAGWLLDTILFNHGTADRRRLEAIYWAQRVFGTLSSTDVGDAAVTLRGYMRYAPLLQLLERTGVRSPALYATMVRRAARLTEAVDAADNSVPMTEFQSILVIIDRIRATRLITATEAEELVGALAALPIDRQGRFGVPLGSWLRTQLLPKLDALSTATEAVLPELALEHALLRAMAGMRPAARLPVLKWEGFDYRLDLAAPRLRRMGEIRRRQGGNSLDAVMRLFEVLEVLSTKTVDLPSVQRAREMLTLAAGRLRQPELEPAVPSGTIPRVESRLKEAIERLARIREPDQVSRAGTVAEDLELVAEYMLAHVLRSLAYTPHLGDPASPLLLDGDVAHRHDLGFLTGQGRPRQDLMWTAPAVRAEDAHWRVEGAIVGIDQVLSYLAMPLIVLGPPPDGPVMKLHDREAFLRLLGAVNPFAASEDGGHAIAAAIKHGRELGAPIESGGPSSQWQVNARAWAQAHEPEAVPALTSVAELFWRGRNRAAGRSLDGWGAYVGDVSGCWCLQVLVGQPWNSLSLNDAGSEVTAYIPDVLFRLAELIDDLGMGMAVVPEVLPRIVQQLLDQGDLGHVDDWTSMLRSIHRIDRQRVEDYVSALAVGGALVPAQDAAP